MEDAINSDPSITTQLGKASSFVDSRLVSARHFDQSSCDDA